MNESQIAHLIAAIHAAEAGRNNACDDRAVFWMDWAHGRATRCEGAASEYDDPTTPGDVPEPVAFLEGGGHVALLNCSPEDFMHLNPVFNKQGLPS